MLTVVLLIFDINDNAPFKNRNPNFVYGVFQAIIAVALLVLCFIVTVGCLILHQRYQKRFARYLSLTREVATTFEEHTDNEDLLDDENVASSSRTSKYGNLTTIKEVCCEESPVVDIEDILPNTSTAETSSEAYVLVWHFFV